MQNTAQNRTLHTRPQPPIPSAAYVAPLPKNWEKAFGYEGEARWLAVWWTPAGDEAMYDDGLISGDGYWVFYLDLVDQRIAIPLAHALASHPRGRYALGSSDEEATHCLLLDLEQRRVFVAPLEDALKFVRAQRQEEISQMPALSPEEWMRLLEVAAQEVQMNVPTAFSVCTGGCMYGWVPDAKGYEPCPVCGGRWLIPVEPEAQQ